MDVRDQFQNWMSQWAEARKVFAESAKPTVEELKAEAAAVAEAPTNANPIQVSTVGMDQNMHDPKSLGATYDVADLENLETLKLKLHDLLAKLNVDKDSKLEAKIVSLQAQIDEISDYLSVEK